MTRRIASQVSIINLIRQIDMLMIVLLFVVKVEVCSILKWSRIWLVMS